MMKRILSCLLSLSMLLSVLPPVTAVSTDSVQQQIVENTQKEPTGTTIGDTTTVIATPPAKVEASTAVAPEDYTPLGLLDVEDLEEQPWLEHLDLGHSVWSLGNEMEWDDAWELPEEDLGWDDLEPVTPEVTVLLIQEAYPWSYNANNVLLEKLLQQGLIDDYTITTMTAAGGLDFSQYTMIMIPSDQTTTVYDTYANEVSDKINAYVANGGILYMSVCDRGHAGGVLSVDLPGGVKRTHSYEGNNYIVDTDHPIVTGELTGGAALTNSLLYGNWCSHESFVESTLPENTNVILRGSSSGAPTLVEYPYGSGYIVASGLTWEFYYDDAGTYASNSYDDVLVYALSQNTYDDSTLPITNLHTEHIGSHSVSLAWLPARNVNVIGYKVYRDGVLVGQTAECAYTDFAPGAATTYTYSIVGYTAGDLEMEPGSLQVLTAAAPTVKELYGENGTEVGFGKSHLYAAVGTDANLKNAQGQFYLVDGETETPIGQPVTEYMITAKGAVYQTNWDISELETGNYQVLFRLTDADGESGQGTAQLKVDNTVPSAIVGLLAQGDIHKIYLSWSIAAEYGVDTYRIYRRESGSDSWTMLQELAGDRYRTTYTDTTAQSGVAYEYAVTAVSSYGVEGQKCEAVSGQLIPDTEKPVVNSLSPARNTVLHGTVTVSAGAVDNDAVASIAVYYRYAGEETGVLIGSAQGASVSARLDTTRLNDGAVELYAIATDLSGNESTGVPVYLCSVDNIGPNQVTELAYTSTATVITLSWKYVQDDDFGHFVVEEKQPDGSFRQVATVNKTLGVNLHGLMPETEHTYRVYAVDQVGNIGAVSEEFTARTGKDDTAPVVSAISPSAGYKNQNFTITFTLKDDAGVAGAQIQVSRNRLNWTTVTEQTFASLSATQSLQYTVNLANYPEDGSVYFRAIPVDNAGNRGDSNPDSAPFVEYILDRQAPGAPRNVTVEENGNGLYILWDNDIAGETASYRVLRAESENGTYTVIASGVRAISYYDRTAKADVTYWYRIVGADQIGNLGDESAAVSGSWTLSADTEKPTVLSIAPADKGLMGGSSTTITALAQDDRETSRIELSYAKVGIMGILTDRQTVTLTGNGSYYLRSSVNPDLTGYKTGDTMQVTVVAFDGNNNASDEVTYTYTIDKTAPAVEQLEAAAQDAQVTITWRAGSDSADLNGYYIYRSNGAGWTKIGTRGSREDGRYSFTDTLTASGDYTYKVTAIDLIGNQADFTSNEVSYTKPENELLIAEFVTDRQQQQGVEYLFDGTASYASHSTIVSYLYDFGDGTTAKGAKTVHAYAQTGTYTVTLTVADDKGVTATSSMTVEVKERASLGNLTVTVVNDSGVPVANAPVHFDMTGDNKIIKYTDGAGRVTFTSNAGTYTVGAYMDGYLPVTKQVIINGSTTRTVELIMVEQPIVTGEFEVNRMTLEQIVAAGININDPANQHCVSVTVQVTYGEQKVNMDFVRNDFGDIVFGSNTTTIGDRQFTAVVLPDWGDWGGSGGDDDGDGGGGGGGGGGHGAKPSDVVVILETPVSASFLKEFFDVKLHIFNQATEEFILKDNFVALNVPDGMTLMQESQHTAMEWKDQLAGQQEWTLSWILRGDKEGDYKLTADYTSVLEQFDADVKATFESPNIHVYGTSAIHLVMNLNKTLRYQACYMDIGIKNVADIDLNMPSVGIVDSMVHAFDSLKDEEGYEGVYVPATAIRTWVENEYGYGVTVEEAPQTLSGGETLFHRYAIYGVTESTDVLYLNDIVLRELKNIGIDQIEVNVNEFDLYPDAVENAEAIMEAGKTTAKNELDYLTNPNNFLYYQNGSEKDDSFFYHAGKVGKNLLDVALKFEFECFTKNESEAFFRSVIAELMSDETVSENVTARINGTYAKATKEILETLSNALQLATAHDGENVKNTFQKLATDDSAVSALSSLLEKEGVSDSFKRRLAIIVTAELGEFGYERIIEILSAPKYKDVVDTTLLTELGDVADVFAFGADLAGGWADAIDAANTMLTLKYAEEEVTYVLEAVKRQLALSGDSNHWMYKEAKKLLEELQASSEDAKATMQRVLNEEVGQVIGELVAEKLAEKVAEVTAKYLVDTVGIAANVVSTAAFVYKVVQVVYSLADYALDISGYFEANDQMIAMMMMNAIFMEEYSTAYEAYDQVHALKYIIKVHLSGERLYVEYIEGDEGRKEDFKKGYGAEVKVYLQDVTKSILSARDKLYNTVSKQLGIPDAPAELTFHYLKGHTYQRFDNQYEYSLNGGESWTTCGDESGLAGYIYVSGKTTAQTLYVRLKATGGSFAGAKAVLALSAAPKHLYATAAGQAETLVALWGLQANTWYEVIRTTEAEPENPDWDAAVRVQTDEKGSLVTNLSDTGDYLLYRLPASAMSFPGQTHSILLARDLQVQISAKAEGDGQVLRNAEAFDACTVAFGETVTLEASFDPATTEFIGWYAEGSLYSTKKTLEIQATDKLELTAKFAPLPQYTMEVIATKGGTVSGGKTVYKGQSVTVRAYAQAGYTFSHWEDSTGKPVSVNSTRTVTLMENVTLKAIFKALPAARIFVNVRVQQVDGMQMPYVVMKRNGTQLTATADSPIREISGSVLQGEQFTLTAVGTQDATFVHWQNETGVVVSTAPNLTVTAEEYNNYTAVYRVKGQSVTFVNKFGNILTSTQYATNIQPQSIKLPTATYADGYQFVGWKLGNESKIYPVDTPEQVAALQAAIAAKVAAGRDVIVNAYHEKLPEKYTITVINGSGSGTYNASDAITLTADAPMEGMYFEGWFEDSVLLSSNVKYSFFVTADRTITARYAQSQVDTVGTTRIETVTGNQGTKKLSFVSMSSVPDDCTILKAGIIATSNSTVGTGDSFTVANAEYVRYSSTEYKNYKYTWTKSKVTDDQHWFVRAYLVYADANGNVYTAYSDVVEATLQDGWK